MPIQIRLTSSDYDALTAAVGQLVAFLGDRVRLNRLRDGHDSQWIVYGTWTPGEPVAAEPGAPFAAPAGRPGAEPPVQIRLICGEGETLTRAAQQLGAGLRGAVELHSARDGRNGEWIVYGTWKALRPVAPPLPAPAGRVVLRDGAAARFGPAYS